MWPRMAYIGPPSQTEKRCSVLRSVVTASLVALCCTFVLFTPEAQAKPFQRGVASWYGPGFHGRLTANGERFNTNSLTAAHRTLPFGTRVRVTNAKTGRSVVVRINDRGPFTKGRVIDLSKAAARAVGIAGVALVVLART
jgi:rare lipoprotein A